MNQWPRGRNLFDPRKAQLVHFHGQLEDVIQTLALGLGLGRVVTPDVAIIIVSGTPLEKSFGLETRRSVLTFHVSARAPHRCRDICSSLPPDLPLGPPRTGCFQ
jgi:hypothetical protein